MLNSRRHRVVAAACAAVVVGTAVVAVAATSPKSGKWKGTTSERNPVTFSVSSNHKQVTNFTTTVTYNGACGPGGGVPNYAVHVAKMTVSKSHSFSAWTTGHLGPFSAKILVSGKFAGTKASGTVGEPSNTCQSPPHKGAKSIWETFSAKHA